MFAQIKNRELGAEIMRHVVAMLPESLDCTDIIGVKGLHEITSLD